MATYGRYSTSGDSDLGTIADGEQRASIMHAMSEHGWATHIGLWAGRTPGGVAPSLELAIWWANNNVPAMLIAQTAAATTNTEMHHGGSGQAYQFAIANSNPAYSPAANAAQLWAGTKYAIGAQVNGAALNHGMVAANNTIDNPYLYYRYGTSVPTDPFNHLSSSYEGRLTAWVQYQPNRKPVAVATGPNGTITTLTPTIGGTFSDLDEAYGDRLRTYELWVRGTGGTTMWRTTFTASSNEQTAKAFSRVYAGAALSCGGSYVYQVRVSDQFGVCSDWSATRALNPAGAGDVDTLNTPTGKQLTRTPSPYNSTWRSQASLSTNAVKVRIWQGNTVVRSSGEIAKSVAPNLGITVTWAETGFATLQWGVTNYSWDMQARDTAGIWSPWSERRSFSTNAAPNVPVPVNPINNVASSNRPKLQARVTDPDNAGTTLTVKARIKDVAGNVLQTRTMTLPVGNTQTFEYQTTSTDLPSHASYRWDAYAYDGTLYSGTQTAEANALAGPEAKFQYAAVPAVAITSPTANQVVTSVAPTIQWTSSDQSWFQITFWKAGAAYDDQHWQTPNVVSTDRFFAVPSGRLRNDTAYEVEVWTRSAAGIWGSSPRVSFTMDFIEPDPVQDFRASPEYQPGDTKPSSILLTWTPSVDPNFAHYTISRRETGSDEITNLVEISGAEQWAWVDHVPASGIDYTYAITVSTWQGLDLTTSIETEAQASITLAHVILVNMTDPSRRVALTLDSERGFDHVDDMVLEQPWGQRAPVAAYGTAQYDVFSGTFSLVTDEVATAGNQISDLRALWKARALACYRDERGRRFFGKITKFTEKDQRRHMYTVDLSLTEVNHDEDILETVDLQLLGG